MTSRAPTTPRFKTWINCNSRRSNSKPLAVSWPIPIPFMRKRHMTKTQFDAFTNQKVWNSRWSLSLAWWRIAPTKREIWRKRGGLAAISRAMHLLIQAIQLLVFSSASIFIDEILVPRPNPPPNTIKIQKSFEQKSYQSRRDHYVF